MMAHDAAEGEADNAAARASSQTPPPRDAVSPVGQFGRNIPPAVVQAIMASVAVVGA